MPTRRLTGLGTGARGVSQSDGSDNFKVAVSCQEGDEPTYVLASVRSTGLGAAVQAGEARLMAYVRRNVDQDIPNVLPQNAPAVGATGTDVPADGKLVFDLDVGVTQGAASPHIIPIAGVVMQDGDCLVVEGSSLTDSGGGNNNAVWGIAVMGNRKSQRQQFAR